MSEEVSVTATETYRLAFRATASPALVAGERFEIEEVTDACTDLVGFSRSELCGAAVSDLFAEPAAFRPAARALNASDAWSGEVELLSSSGRLLPVDCTVQSFGADGYVVAFSDRTDARQYEGGIRILDRVLRHNLRNDANIVLGYLENVIGNVDGRDREQLLAAADAVEGLLRRAETAREFSDVFASGDGGPLGPVRLDDAVIRTVADADTADARINMDLQPVRVVADDTLDAAVAALVENAIEHNHRPEPRVSVSIDEYEHGVVLRVVDDGPGIPRDRRRQAFGREEESKTRHGDGLSLFFVDCLMEQYGGDARIRDDSVGGAALELVFRKAE